MEDATYVAHLTGQIDSPFKHFKERAHARAFADGQIRIGQTERAVIYKVSVTDPLKVGKAEAR